MAKLLTSARTFVRTHPAVTVSAGLLITAGLQLAAGQPDQAAGSAVSALSVLGIHLSGKAPEAAS